MSVCKRQKVKIREAAEKEEYEEKQKELEGVALPILKNMASGGMPGGMPGTAPGASAPAGDFPMGGAAHGPSIEELD